MVVTMLQTLLLTVLTVVNALCVQSTSPKEDVASVNSIDDTVFITEHIEKGEIELARLRSLVRNLPNAPPVKSYAGFITVDKQYESNMFFWFFPTLNKSAPVFLWLQGGPGSPSLFGLFNENGPLVVDQDLNVSLREYSWTREYSMLYIDNPVGAGFSFTQDERGYSTTEEEVAANLHEALRQFFVVFHEYKASDLYLTGESYAGKFVPALGYRIHSNNSVGFNLKGIILNNALIDPVSMLNFADHLYQVGLVDEKQAAYFRKEQNRMVQLIKEEKYAEAFPIFDGLILNKLTVKGPSYLTKVSGYKMFYNIIKTVRPPNFNYFVRYVRQPKVKKALHVGTADMHYDYTVEKHMLNDILKSVKPWFEVMLDNYKVLLYNGQLDIIVAAPLTESFLQTAQWKHRDEYLQAERRIWQVDPQDEEIAGYVRQAHTFYQVIVRNAGHMVPHDQPRAVYDLVHKFINGGL